MKNVLNYIGKMDKIHLKQYIPESIHTYVEPFAGSFSCGFNLITDGFRGNTVINDKDSFIYDFWFCTKDNPHKLYYIIMNFYLKHKSETEDDFRKSLDILKDSIDCYDRAAYAYLYNNLNNFSKQALNNKVKTPEPIIDFIRIAKLMNKTEVNNMDYSEIIVKYDSNSTLFMMDPPYDTKNVNRYYRENPIKFSHKDLRKRLDNIQGKWIVRYKESKQITKLYKDTNILFVDKRKILGYDYTEIYYTNLETRE